MFSSKSFIVSIFTFRSLIHFEFIFVCGVRECPSFILLQAAVQFSQHSLLKRHSPLYILDTLLYYRLIGHRCVGLVLSFLSCSIDLCDCFLPKPYCFDYCGFAILCELREPPALQLSFSLSRVLWLFWVFIISIQIIFLLPVL